MLKQRHQHLHAGATSCNSTSLAAAGADCRSSMSACSSQQAAAAWAWFQHGGSSCITPSKAEGLVAAKRHAKHISTAPSRFKTEVDLISTGKIPQQGAADHDHASPRRHSFHNDLTDRTSYMYQRFSSSCRSAPGSPCFNFDDSPIHDQNEAENEEGGNISCLQDEASSLFDKFEIEAVCRQLHDHLSSMSGRSPSCSPSLSSTCRSEPQEYYESQKAHHDHPQAHLKARRYFESSNAAALKPSADNENHHTINDVVHRLLHLRIKTLSGRSTSAAPAAPLYCSSIATADSIVDHRHRHSPKQLGAVTPINQTAKWAQAALCDQGIRQNVGRVCNYSGELKLNQVSSTADEGSAAADEHERGDFTSRAHHKSQHKGRPRRDHELIGVGAPTTPITSLHQSDAKYSKALQRLVSRLAHRSPSVGHHMDEAGQKSWQDDGVLACSKNRDHHFHEHHHIHHHHHHYHHLQQRNQASQQYGAVGLLQDREGDGANVVQATKLYRLHKEEFHMIPANGGAGAGQRPHEHKNSPSLAAGQAPQKLARPPAAADYKAEKCLSYNSTFQVPGPLMLFPPTI